MSLLDTLAQGVALVACLALILIAEPRLNRVTVKHTPLAIRLALLLICAGALLGVFSALPVLPTPWPAVAAMASGVALLMAFSRRRSGP